MSAAATGVGGAQRATLPGALRADGRPRQLDERAGRAILDEPLPIARLPAAFDAARRLRDRAAETGNRQHRAWALRCLAVCALRRNDPAEAVAQLHGALGASARPPPSTSASRRWECSPWRSCRTGDVWSARATAKEGLAQVVHVKRPIGHSTLEGYSSC